MIRKTSQQLRTITRWGALGLASAVLLAACGGGPGGGEGGGGDSVPEGASKEEYRAAFADAEPVELNTQTGGPQGSRLSSFMEEYFAAVEDWSDGRITFNVDYANAVASPAEADDAVEDGRLDLAGSLPTYDPDNYPALNAVIDLSFLASQTPLVGPLQLAGWLTEVAASRPEVEEEYEARGLYALVPLYHAGLDALICTEHRTSLADLDGASSRAAARVHSEQLAGLGMEGVSLDFTELFEGMQRGVVDCANASPLSAGLGGLFEIAPHVTIDPEVGFAAGTGSIIINRDLWESLPLVSRQLLHDRLDVYYRHQLDSTFESYVNMVEAVEEYDGEIAAFKEDARQALEAANEQLVEEAAGSAAYEDPEGFVGSVVDASERWHATVTDDLGFTEDMSPQKFVEWYRDQEPEVWDEFVARLASEALDGRRPE